MGERHRRSHSVLPRPVRTLTVRIINPGGGGLVRWLGKSHLKHANIVTRAPASRSYFAGPECRRRDQGQRTL